VKALIKGKKGEGECFDKFGIGASKECIFVTICKT
jgi:hypothetical protein